MIPVFVHTQSINKTSYVTRTELFVDGGFAQVLKEASMSRCPEWDQYKRHTWLLLPLPFRVTNVSNPARTVRLCQSVPLLLPSPPLCFSLERGAFGSPLRSIEKSLDRFVVPGRHVGYRLEQETGIGNQETKGHL